MGLRALTAQKGSHMQKRKVGQPRKGWKDSARKRHETRPAVTVKIYQGMMTDLEKIMTDCRAAADYYDERPGHAGPETMSDIYRTIHRLAEVLHKRELPPPNTETDR